MLATTAGILAILSSCQKEVDVSKNDELMGTPLPTTGLYCRIESIWENPGAMDERFWLIGYDDFENPTFITTPLPSTGLPFRTFKYDSWHRLSEYRGEYSNGHFETWSFYGYDLNGRIGSETRYSLGTLGEVPTNYFLKTLINYEYDGQGRITRAYGTFIPTMGTGGSFDDHYSYDGAGNLVRPGVVYDNKQNMNRTNDIWQFLRRDYSMNNPFSASVYNATGFPTTISQPVGSAPWIMSDLSNCQIGYGCRQSFYH
jgi:hypothetical protein